MNKKQTRNLILLAAIGVGGYLIWKYWKSPPAGTPTTAADGTLPSTQVSSGPDLQSTLPVSSTPVTVTSQSISGFGPIQSII